MRYKIRKLLIGASYNVIKKINSKKSQKPSFAYSINRIVRTNSHRISPLGEESDKGKETLTKYKPRFTTNIFKLRHQLSQMSGKLPYTGLKTLMMRF